MAEVTMSLKHLPVTHEQPCGVCGASFVAAEDSGSRMLGLRSGPQEFAFLLCGGCFSKWSHGATLRMQSVPAPVPTK